MKTYLVKFTRQIPTEMKFEVEANNPVKAVEEARIQFEDIDWLPNTKGEFVSERAIGHFGGGRFNQGRALVVQFSERFVDSCRRQFQDAESANDGGGHGVVGNGEMMQAACRLSTPVAIRRDLNLAHRVGLNSYIAHWHSFARLAPVSTFARLEVQTESRGFSSVAGANLKQRPKGNSVERHSF